ncbi:MAG TPA: hypothetical protein DCE56_35200 [Cyanobacteria bacterium UBA8553]|nr:hypothetical protein [Cyanobacteria bacterium UBA8553]HAJ61396.1 hypothetical protein [Cyanobacteria bacterium UBA8543]
MSEQNSKNHQIIPTDLESLSFDSFERSSWDIVCVAPVRTIVRREEEIVLIRRVRKVEEIDASPACPINSVQVSGVQHEGQPTSYEEKKSETGAY